MIPGKEKLEGYLEILSCIMRVQDWDIEVFLVNDNEMIGIKGKGYLGANAINRNLKASKIYINTEQKENEEDWYNTLIHELFHLVHDDLDDWAQEHLESDKLKDNYEVEMERNVCRLTRIFTSVYPVESLSENDES